MIKTTLTSILIVLFGLMVANGEESKYLEYSIPSDADKYGPFASRQRDLKYTNYYRKGGAPRNATDLVGEEYHRNGLLIKRALYKKGKLHGVQKEWTNTGVLKSKAPYKEGVMHGEFVHWNEDGQLNGQYEIINGEGIRYLFHKNGYLSQVKYYANSKGEGWSLKFHTNGKIKVVNKEKEGVYLANYSAAFYESGKLYLIAVGDNETSLNNGMIAYYNRKGDLREILCRLNGETVNQAVYLEALNKNASLPPIFEDPQKYKKLLSQQIKDLIVAYSSVEPVKIPLEFDDKGDLLTKTGRPFTLPKK